MRVSAITNNRIGAPSDIIVEPSSNINSVRSSTRVLAAKTIQTLRAKQRVYVTRNLNSYGRAESGENGFGAPLRNPGYVGVPPPVTYRFNNRPIYQALFSDILNNHLGVSDNTNIPYSKLPARTTGFCCPPKNINLR
uniref:Uncharacterized protein n=1 Tax=viral metagenome TaxID=1070528 RepID=A0A6C0BTF0_9ZZZZ